jgi:hypothetical protein
MHFSMRELLIREPYPSFQPASNQYLPPAKTHEQFLCLREAVLLLKLNHSSQTICRRVLRFMRELGSKKENR